jgi:hypothetical protein
MRPPPGKTLYYLFLKAKKYNKIGSLKQSAKNGNPTIVGIR